MLADRRDFVGVRSVHVDDFLGRDHRGTSRLRLPPHQGGRADVKPTRKRGTRSARVRPGQRHPTPARLDSHQPIDDISRFDDLVPIP